MYIISQNNYYLLSLLFYLIIADAAMDCSLTNYNKYMILVRSFS